MTRITFLKADGSFDREVDAPAGSLLLDVAQAEGQPLEGACEGAMACSTCHVIIDPVGFEKLPPASEEEDDLLDFAAFVTRTSRLACQVVLNENLEELVVRMPGKHHDMQGR